MKIANILIDLECPIGSTTKLAKILKESGLNSQLISYNIIRLRLTEDIDNLRLGFFLSKVESILTIIYDLKNNWNVLCIESWIEEHVARRVTASKLVEIDNICMYFRSGPRNRVVYKIAWLDKCASASKSSIPESVTRLCIENTPSEDISAKLAVVLNKIKEFLTTSLSLNPLEYTK